MSVGLRENQVLSLTICKRLLRDERCLEVTQARCVKCESVDFMQLQDLCECVPAQDFAEKRSVVVPQMASWEVVVCHRHE